MSDVNMTEKGTPHINPATGMTQFRLPAGGGGSFVDVPATDAEHIQHLATIATAKEQEAVSARDAHKLAVETLGKKTEIYPDPKTGAVHKRMPGAQASELDPLATDEEAKEFNDKLKAADRNVVHTPRAAVASPEATHPPGTIDNIPATSPPHPFNPGLPPPDRTLPPKFGSQVSSSSSSSSTAHPPGTTPPPPMTPRKPSEG
jgi:hypothetical protein